MKQLIRIGARAGVALAAALLLIAMPTAPAGAQGSDSADAADIEALSNEIARLVDALVVVDLDNNDVADFDASNDGVAEFALRDFGDLQALPGTDDFDQLIRTTLELGIGPSDNDVSLSADCVGMVLSFDSDGNMIDWALGAGAAHRANSNGMMVDLFPQSTTGSNVFTTDNPFVVGDRLVIIGTIGPAAAGTSNHAAAWQASSAGLPLGNGGSTVTATNGVGVSDVVIADHALAGFAEPVGVHPIDASVEIAELLCQTTGWVQFDQGMPLLTNVGIAASGLSVFGALGLFLTARPARAWKTDEKA